MSVQLKNGASETRELPGYISFDQFLELGEQYKHSEWVDGKVILMSAVSDVHASLKGDIWSYVKAYVDELDLGVVRDEPFQMKTGPDLPSRAPDVMFIAKKNLRRLKPQYLEGPADIAIEVISPGTRSIDRGDKFYEYERGGVREYWLLDPERKQAEFYILGRDRIYRPVVVADDGIFRSTVLKDLWLNVAWLWKTPRPTAAKLLKEWGII
jgi:Uma2 family endonuclease